MKIMIIVLSGFMLSGCFVLRFAGVLLSFMDYLAGDGYNIERFFFDDFLWN